MREIKFRGKSIITGEWLFGDLIQAKDTNRYAIVPQAHGWVNYEVYEVIPETVGQFTGLKDFNGVEIYENDIIKITHINGGEEVEGIINVVRYKSGQFTSLPFGIYTTKYEVIGNTPFEEKRFAEESTK